MGIARGTNTVRDGLIYGYDNGHNPSITGLDSQPHHNDYRFYKGIPATNVISSGIPGYFGSGGTTLYQKTLNGFSSASGVFQRNYVTNPAQANTSTYNNNAGLFHSGLSFNSISANTEYIMISFDFYMITPYVRHSSSGTGLNGYLGVTYTDGSGDNHGWNTSLAGNAGDDWSNNSAYVGKWRKIALIADLTDSKTPSSINAMYIYNDRTLQGEGIFTNFVITQHTTLPTFPAQWITQGGSRSNTTCLNDLARTRDISVANMSFDSTGQPTFDGTDDYIPTTITRGNLGDTLTIIAYYKYTGTSGRGYTPIIGGFESGTGTEFFIGKNSGNTHIGVQDGNYTGSFVQGSDAWDGNYHQIVYTYDNGTGKIYLDGVLKNTGSFTKCNSAEIIHIGREAESGGYWFLGDIPRVCFYSKVLTAAEVTQDFEAYKNRFNL